MADFAALKIAVKVDDVEKAAKLLKELGVSADKAGSAVDKMGNKTDKAAQQAKKFQQNLNKFSSGLRTFANNVSMYVVLPLIGIGTAAVKASVELNKGLANVGTLIPGQMDELNQYKEQIKSLSVETGKTFDDLTRGLYEVISAFPGTREAIAITETASKAAIAGLSTTKQALDLLSATTKAYGDTSAEAQQKVSDLAFTAVKFGQTTFLEVSSAIQKVTASTVQLGVSQEELFSVFSTFTGVTGDAEMVATQLRSALISLLNPTVELRNMFTLMGYEGAQAGKNLIAEKGLLGAFRAIEAQAKELDLPIQKYMRRIEGITFAQQLLGPLQEKFISDMGEMADVTGATEIALEQQTDGINKWGFALSQSKQRIQVALSDLGDKIAPMFSQLAIDVTTFIEKVTESESTLYTFVQIGKDLIIFGAVAKGISLATSAISAMTPIITKLAAALGIAAGPLGIIAGIAAAGVVTVKIISSNASGNALDQVNDAGVDTGNLTSGQQLDVLSQMRDFEHTLRKMNLPDSNTEMALLQERIEEVAKAFGISERTVMDMTLSQDDLTGRTRDYITEIIRYTEYNDALVAQYKNLEKAQQKDIDQLRTLKGIRQEIEGKEAVELYDEGLQSRIQTILDMTSRGLFTLEEENAKLIGLRQEALDTWRDKVEQAGGVATEKEEAFIKVQIAALERLRKKLGVVAGETDLWTEAIKEYVNEVKKLSTLESIGFISSTDAMMGEIDALDALVETGGKLGVEGPKILFFLEKLQNMQSELNLQQASKSLSDYADAMEKVMLAGISDRPGEFASGGLEQDLEFYKSAVELTKGMISELEQSGPFEGQAAMIKLLNADLEEYNEKLAITQLTYSAITDVMSQLYGAVFDFGMAMADSEDKMKSFEEMMGQLFISILKTISALAIQVGLQLLASSGGTNVAGWALVGGGLAGQFTAGLTQGYTNQANAKGGVYGYADGGAFTNSIVNSPTQFAFANGVGLMGEAGPEAIMPLSRTQDGRLGVAASGGSDKDVIINIVNQANNSEVETRERETSTGKEIDVIIKSKMAQAVATGSIDGPMRSRYGVSPKGFR